MTAAGTAKLTLEINRIGAEDSINTTEVFAAKLMQGRVLTNKRVSRAFIFLKDKK